MPVRDDVVLVADGGEMTVGRQLATYAFGQFQTILPDGEEQVESDSRLQNGYIYRPDNPPSGRFDVGFVRADVSIDLGAQTSDLEDVIDTAQKRVAGEVYFEREISGPGLGRYRGGVDFEISDLVWVEIWGKRLQLPVTSIEDYFDSGALSERVHVGGQIISDVAQLKRHNDGLLQQIQNERAQLLRRVEGAREEARSLVAAERDARENALRLEERARESGLTAEQQARFEAFEREQQAREREVQAVREDASNAVAAEERKRKQALQSGLSAEQAAREEALKREAQKRESGLTAEQQARESGLSAEQQARQEALREEQQARQEALESGLSAEQQAREEALRVTREQWQEKLRLERIAREEGITAEQVARREALEAEQAARREGFKAAERAREFLTQEISQQRTSADERFKELRAFLTGAGKDQSDLVAALEGLNQQLRRNGAEPAPGLVPAYMQLNTELWEMQTKLNEALQQADEALKKGQEANATAIELNRRVGEQNARIAHANSELNQTTAEVAQTNRELIQVQQAIAEMNRARIAQIEHDNAQRDKLFAQLQQQERATKAQRMRVFSLGSGSDSHWSYSSSNGRLVAKGSWRGDVQAVTTVERSDSRGAKHHMLEAWEEQVPKRGGSRTYQVEIANGNGLVWYHVQPGQSRVISMDRSNFTPNYASWHQVDAFNVQSTGTHNFQARVIWDAVHRGANYQLRVSVDNRVVISDSSGTSWGPMWPWENGVRSQEAPLTSLDLRAGQRVKFEVYSDAQKSSSRVIQSAVCKAHWIDD
ncbi:hypothetical protein QP924_09945 [Corynebacterium pseudodiphtheriticum]|uniref:hypothetical protein n=1 Tax=Corynebacterium pseudodiphtheriticum TaxID=37637 RepID=UPI00254D3044|nr:hypothetical protein [Corynebacterium pseudodiphtheriticum]MDK8701157.1 hypothetical protein [Corynebacterium pseudodiphtheriticum]